MLVACGCLLGARVAGLALSGVLEFGLLGFCARRTLGCPALARLLLGRSAAASPLLGRRWACAELPLGICSASA
eukprot:12887751-Prorocentrum_lima.AAC.1